MTPVVVKCTWSEFWTLNAARVAVLASNARKRFARGETM